MPSCAVENDDGMGLGRNTIGNLAQVSIESPAIGVGHDKGCADGALRADCAEDVGPFVALIARRAGPCASFGPDAGQRALLADACLVLEPDFDGLVFGVVGEPCRDRCGEVFLKASCAASSVWG